jgi:hypothetical protein
LALAEEYVKGVLAQEALAKAKAAPKSTTITCVKGKAITKVTKVNPVCPKGYTKKK